MNTIIGLQATVDADTHITRLGVTCALCHSHPTAVREHEISVIPDAPHAMSPTHDEAVSDGRSEADVLGVDAWLTEDHTHVVKIASHRAPDK